MSRPARAHSSRLFVRLLQSLFVVWAAATAAFILMRAAPGDPYTQQMDVPANRRAQWVAQRGLDQPIHVQYIKWLRNLAVGELGESSRYNRPVRDVLRDVLPRTLLLMSLALTASVLLGMAVGAWQGTRVGTTGDSLVSTASLFAYSVPEFWLGILLVQLFAQSLGWLPASGMVSVEYEYLPFSEQIVDRIRHLVLPLTALTLLGTSLFARFQRSSMRDAWNEPYVQTARAKGLAERGVRWHAWRTALVPVVTMFGLMFPSLLGGAVFVESIFSWPGMGHTAVIAVSARDYNLVVAAVIVGSVMTVTGSLIADILQRAVDPRTTT